MLVNLLHSIYLIARVCFMLFLFLCGSKLFCQNSSYGDINKRITPQPPNVNSLLKFNEVPVNNFNGTANIGIPLFEIKQKSIDIPFALNYHTGGIKVTEEASWVGLGWNLNVGGAIQEIIVGEPDDQAHGFMISNYNAAPKPIPPPGGWPSATATYNITESGFCYYNASNNFVSFDPTALYRSNFEYDLFSFSFDGNSGKFIMPDTQNGECLDRQNIVFSKLVPGSFTSGIKAIASDGTKYIFDVIGYTSTERICDPSFPSSPPRKARTWYLSKIIYPDNQEVIFTYTKTISRTLPVLNESWTYREFEPNYKVHSASQNNLTQSYSTIENFYLTNIQFTNGSVNFITSPRLDMESSYKLDVIRLNVSSSSGNTIIKQVNFTYEYFDGIGLNSQNDWTANTPLWNQSLSCEGMNYYIPTNDHKSKRLKLAKVEMLDLVNGTASSPAYRLEYNSPSLPVKTSLSQDLWGFYNGILSNTTSILPDYNNLGYWDSEVPYAILSTTNKPTLANRSVNSNAFAGMLTKIIYPTGGYSIFNYESNQVINPNPGTHSTVVDASVSIEDISRSGYQQTQFTIPSVGLWVPNSDGTGYMDGNPVKIDIRLWCCQGYLTCSDNGSACNVYDPYFPTRGLYAKLEYYDPQTNQWTLHPSHLWDVSSQVAINNQGNFSLNKNLRPGTYRITANYPDNAPLAGAVLNRSAFVFIRYKNNQPIFNPPTITVGGLRINSILDFAKEGMLSNQRIFSYSGGKLMTKPLFYRKYTLDNASHMLSPDCSGDHVYDHIGDGMATCGGCAGSIPVSPPPLGYTEYSLYSNPVSNYSYSAQGALVGYETVTITNSSGTENGKSEYVYNCFSDNYNTYNSLISPGIPTSPEFLNGTIKEQIFYKKTGNVFEHIKKVKYNYDVFGYDQRWCFKSEYHPFIKYACDGASTSSTCGIKTSTTYSYRQFLLNFYPIKFGRVNLKSKDEILYEGTKQLVSTTNYEYNNTNQLRRTLSSNSKNQNLTSETYYPSDYTNSTGFIADMRNRNMLDYPIETVSKVNGQAIDALFNEYNTHDDMISPSQIYKINASSPYSINLSAPVGTKDSRYTLEATILTDHNGNNTQVQKANDIKKSYLWGYNRSYLVAEVVGVDQITISGLVDQAILDNPTSTEAQIITQLTNLRNGLAPSKTVTTYTYKPLTGMTSQTDASGRITYYKYDGLGRLWLVLDQDRNIVKKYCYKYDGQSGNCDVFTNGRVSILFTKNDCISCVGPVKDYSVMENTYFASSQEEADSMAIQEALSLGQTNANQNDTCSENTGSGNEGGFNTIPVQFSNLPQATGWVYLFNVVTGSDYYFLLDGTTSGILGYISAGTYTLCIGIPASYHINSCTYNSYEFTNYHNFYSTQISNNCHTISINN